MSGNDAPAEDPAGEADAADADPAGADGEQAVERVERSFTCSLCGFPMTHETAPLVAQVHGVCHNCGEWTAQTAAREELVAAARDAAATLAGEVLTERQALAYVLREALDADRDAAADVLDSSPSNVDNLYRRAVEKVTDAERVVGTLDALTGDGGEDDGEREEREDGGDDGPVPRR